MRPRRPTANELDEVIELVENEQRRSAGNIAYLGTEVVGIRAELADLAPPWSETARIIAANGSVVGAVFVEVDVELHRAWVHGPWVADQEPSWEVHASALVSAALEQLPPEIDDQEMAGHVDNVRLASLATHLGWQAGVVNHALVADESTVLRWPVTEAGDIRPVQPGDADRITPLHDQEFPETYMTGSQLETRALQGEIVTLVSIGDDANVVAYAAGRVHADGEGFIDFVAVDPPWRGQGRARRLVMSLAQTLVSRSSLRRVGLVVHDHRIAARALYEELGFRSDGSFVGYRMKG